MTDSDDDKDPLLELVGDLLRHALQATNRPSPVGPTSYVSDYDHSGADVSMLVRLVDGMRLPLPDLAKLAAGIDIDGPITEKFLKYYELEGRTELDCLHFDHAMFNVRMAFCTVALAMTATLQSHSGRFPVDNSDPIHATATRTYGAIRP